MSLGKIGIDFNNATSGVLAIGATSVTAALPANCKLLGITTAGNCHFRITPAALATAVGTDPLLTPNSEIQVIVVPGDATNISIIQDGTATGNFSYFRVFEG